MEQMHHEKIGGEGFCRNLGGKCVNYSCTYPYVSAINFLYKIKNLLYWQLRLGLMTVVTWCQILRLNCTKFDFGWGSAPDPAGGAYSAPPDPLAGFKGAYF